MITKTKLMSLMEDDRRHEHRWKERTTQGGEGLKTSAGRRVTGCRGSSRMERDGKL